MKLQPRGELGTRRGQRTSDVLGEAPEKQHTFNPKKDVPAENQALWRDRGLEEFYANGEAWNVYALHLLFPEQTIEVSKLKRDDLHETRDFLAWALLNPEEKKTAGEKLLRYMGAKRALDLLPQHLGTNSEIELMVKVVTLRTLFPGTLEEESKQLDEIWGKGVRALQEFAESGISQADLLTWMRLAFPERFSEAILTPVVWQRLRAEGEGHWREELVSGRPRFSKASGFESAFNLTILAASDVSFGPSGLEISSPHKPRAPKSLPNRSVM